MRINQKFIILCFFIICLPLKASPNQYYNNSWALIIGINKYSNAPRLNYAVEDAEAINSLLIDFFNFPEQNVEMLLDEEATLIGIKRALRDLSENAKERDRVLIYFAGHGETDALAAGGERGYLLPINGDKDDLYLTALPMDEIKNFSNMTAAKDVLFLMDACYSGLLGMTRGLKSQTNFTLEKMSRGGSRQVITAGQKGELAIEKPEWGHSAFAKNLIKGLKDGMADYSNDGIITGSELGMYLENKVTEDTQGAQSPNSARFTNDEGEFMFIYVDDLIVSTSSSNESASIPSVVSITKDGTVLIDSSFFNSDTEIPEWLGSIFNTAKKVGVAKADSPDEWVEEIIDDVGLDSFGLIDSKDDTLQFRGYKNSAFIKSPTWHFADEDGEEDHWMRYNRSEGLFIQLNGVFQSPKIKGSSFYGGIGRAFHSNQWQYIFGLEQLFNIPPLKWNNKFQLYFEVFNKSITNDAWRMGDDLNSISALFLRKDYLDWYNGEGYRFGSYFHINNYISIGAEYNDLKQAAMHNVLDGFRPSYRIEEGKNTYLKSILSIGHPIDSSVREEFQMYSNIIRTTSMIGSDIDYNYDHFLFEVLIPYTEDLNFNIKLLAGASDVKKDVYNEYKQNIFEIGGLGTLRGHNWKTLSSSHYQLSKIEIWYESIGIFYDHAIIFDSPGNVFSQAYLSDFADNISQNNYSGIGLGFGDSDFNLSFAKEINGNQGMTIYFSIGSPMQYW